MKKLEPVQKWIIGQSGGYADDVDTYIVEGTKTQVKKHIQSLIKADVNEGYHSSDYGTTKLSELKEREDGTIYGYAVFHDYHNDYTARPLMEAMHLDNRGEIITKKALFATDILWETDGNEVDLPDEVRLPDEALSDEDFDVANWLSDQYGWLILGVHTEKREVAA